MSPMRFNSPQDMLNSLSQQDFIRNNPTKQGWVEAMQNAQRTGDTSEVEQIARNICQGFNMNPIQAFQMVMGKLIRRN